MTDFSKHRYVDNFSFRLRFVRSIWSFVWLVFFRPTPRGAAFARWRILLLRLFGAKIGKGCRFAPSVFVWAPWNLVVGEYSAFGDGVELYSMGMITIGSKVAVSQRSFICCGSHDISSLSRPLIVKSISIEDYAWVCAESYVGPGVTIGRGAVVAARACVSRNVDEFAVVAGNPAVFVKRRNIVE